MDHLLSKEPALPEGRGQSSNPTSS